MKSCSLSKEGEVLDRNTKLKDKEHKPLGALDKFDYYKVIENSSVQGYFKGIPDKFKYLINSDAVKKLKLKGEFKDKIQYQKELTDSNYIDNLLYTILAVLILRTQCQNTCSEWQMIELKAINYLRSQGITNLNKILDEIRSEIK